MKRIILLGVAALFSAVFSSAYAQSVLGSWNGQLEIGPQKLNIVFHMTVDESGKRHCFMDSPDQGATGIRAEVLHMSDDSLSIAIKSIGLSYTGKLAGHNDIKGTFMQSGLKLPLDLKRGLIVRNRPQHPSEPYPYTTEDIKFRNEKADVTLSGTLTYPVGYDGSKKVPVVVMVTGSGLEDRNEEVYEHKPFLVIADYLARNGIASLRYDDRGFGESTGNGAIATTPDFTDDAAAGYEMLKSTGRFDKIGILGHSEGGCIAFMAAARGKADFIVSLAGVGVKADVALTAQANKINELMGVPTVSTVVQYRESVKQLKSPWMDWFIDYDPEADIKGTKCPAMAVNGSKDVQVISTLNLEGIRKNLPSNPENLIREYEGLNHLFQTCGTGLPQEYSGIEETFSQQVLKDIADWINGL